MAPRAGSVLRIAAAALALVAAVVAGRSCVERLRAARIEAPPQGGGAETSRAVRRGDASRAAAPAPSAAPAEPERPEPAEPRPAPESPAPDPGTRVHGRVADEDGAPVGGAGIEVRTWTEKAFVASFGRVLSAPDGTFECTLAADRAGTSFGIETDAEGFAPSWVPTRWADYDAARGVTIVVEPARAITGRVVDVRGDPIPDASAYAWFGMETTYWRKVEPDGRFRIPQRVPRRAVDLVVEAPGFPRRVIPLAATAADVTDVGDVVFRVAGAIRGVVVDAEGLPVPDVRVELLGLPAGRAGAPAATTDAVGNFEFLDVGEGPVTVSVQSEGGAPGARRAVQGNVEGVRAGGPAVRVVVRPEFVVVLRLTDAVTGAPVSVTKAEYGCRAAGTPEPEGLGQSVSASDGVTTLRFSVLDRGRYDFTVRTAGYEPARLTGVEVGGAPSVRIDLPLRRAQ